MLAAALPLPTLTYFLSYPDPLQHSCHMPDWKEGMLFFLGVFYIVNFFLIDLMHIYLNRKKYTFEVARMWAKSVCGKHFKLFKP